MDEWYELRKGLQFRRGSAKGVTLKKWLSIWDNKDYLNEGEAEKLYYECGGKSKKKNEY